MRDLVQIATSCTARPDDHSADPTGALDRFASVDLPDRWIREFGGSRTAEVTAAKARAIAWGKQRLDSSGASRPQRHRVQQRAHRPRASTHRARATKGQARDRGRTTRCRRGRYSVCSLVDLAAHCANRRTARQQPFGPGKLSDVLPRLGPTTIRLCSRFY